jgi:hypothetical protein
VTDTVYILSISFMPVSCDTRAELIEEYDLGVIRQDWYDGAHITQWGGEDGKAVIIDRKIPGDRLFVNHCQHYMAMLV